MPVEKILNARVPVKVWTDRIEPEAIEQLKNTASLPFVFKHVAAMPDVHLGKGATVGSVIATEGAVVPAAVGVDIGCGMCAVKLPDPDLGYFAQGTPEYDAYLRDLLWAQDYAATNRQVMMSRVLRQVGE